MGWLRAFWGRSAFWVGVSVLFSTIAVAGNGAITREEQLQYLSEMKSFPWDDRAFVDQINRSKFHRIDLKQNQGYTDQCGFYALSHALSGFDISGPSGKTLYLFARENGWYWKESGTTIGGNLYDTAKNLGGLKVEHGWGFSGGTTKYLKTLIRWGFGVVVAVRGVSGDGLPAYSNFFKVGGHWVALEGFVTIRGRDYFIIKDSNIYGNEPAYIEKHLEGSNLWPIELFEKSWSFGSYVAVKPLP